jgi:hypothetical protein
MAKPGYVGEYENFNFRLRGRAICEAALNTALPSTIEPIDLDNLPVDWTYLGPTENQEVRVSVDVQTEDINVGVVPTAVRTYITGQTGTVEASLFFYQPNIMGIAFGQDPETFVAASGGDRGYQDLFLGGSLGDFKALMILEDFDDDLIENDVTGKTWEQMLLYSPKTQASASVDFSAAIGRAPAVPYRKSLLAFTNVAAGERSLLLQSRWIEAV